MTISIAPQHSFTYDGAQVAVFHANQGEGIPRHEHIYAHATFCTSGSCVIRKEGKEIIFNLIAGEWHEIEALENNTVFINVFSEGKQG